MRSTKELLLAVVEAKARRRTGQLACDLVRATSANRELVLAELQFERWLAESCRDCRFGS